MKVARTVLRGVGCSDASRLPDQALGGQVRKGEHGSMVVFANAIHKTEIDGATGEEVEVEIPFMKGYTVFNVDQIDGLPDRYRATAPALILSDAERSARLDAFFAATGATIHHGGNRAYYAIHFDWIQMPPFESFHDTESYYATLAHEITHNAVTGFMPHGRPIRWICERSTMRRPA